MTNEIPVVFAVNNDYVPYLGVALSSLISCADDMRLYSVYILHTNLTAESQECLQTLSKENVTVRCQNVSQEMEEILIVSTNHLTVEATFRILIPELFPQYEKVLYLDSDLVVLRDISSLFDVDLGNYIVGAAREIVTKSWQKYVTQMNVDIPIENFFNSGVLLINVKRFVEQGIKDKCFQLLDGNTRYAYLDQDVLNITCYGNVKYLDGRWNCNWQHWFLSPPLPIHEEYFRQISSDPWIVHFTSNKKPWAFPEFKFGGYFWEQARKTQFYEEIIFKNIEKRINSYFKE